MGFTGEELSEIYRRMRTIRSFEEKLHELVSAGKIGGFMHLYAGQEAIAVGVCAQLKQTDLVGSTHRGHGHCVAKGVDVKAMMAELFGRSTGTNRGKGGSMHIADMSVGILGANGIVGGGFGISTGAGLSAKLRGSDQVAVCFFGDGAANQGIMLETVNMAAVWNLPVIYVCENNQYGEHTPYQTVTGVIDIADRAKGMGLEGIIADGTDVLAMYETTSVAVAKARRGDGPTLIEAKTYRYHGHHVGDAQTYRTRDEVGWWSDNKDPIRLLGDYMVTNKVAKQDELDGLYGQVEQEVLDAIEFGKDAPFPPPEQACLLYTSPSPRDS